MKNFISINDVSDVNELLNQTQKIKQYPFDFKSFGKNKTLGLLFFNPSLRTRLSTQKAAMNLGMNVIVMNLNQEGWQIEFQDGTVMNQGKQEHIKEAAAVISQYCDIIGIRTFPNLKNQKEDYEEKIIHQFIRNSKVPVVSLESATLHPLQGFTDLLTIEENKKIEYPKVVLTWAPHVKALPQAVANSFVNWLKSTDYQLVITNPKGFDLPDSITDGIKICHDQNEALKDTDFVYAKNWSSFYDYGKIGNELPATVI